MKQSMLVLIVLAGAVLAAQPAALTPEQTLDRRAIGEPDFSPMGRAWHSPSPSP